MIRSRSGDPDDEVVTTASPAPALLPRQAEVVRLVGAGTTTQEAAARLGIRPAAAWLHRYCAWRRAGCSTIDELLELAVRSGWI